MAVYTLFSQGATGSSLTADNLGYTMGVQFSVTLTGGQTATMSGIWFYSATGATVLPATITLWDTTGTLIHSETPSWSGAAGSGWVRSSFSSPPSLTSGTNYVGSVFYGGGSNWYSTIAHYWDTGAGQNGITNGPLSAPNNAGASHGQDSFNQAVSQQFPNTSFNATNYWMDPEVTVTSPGINVNGVTALVNVAAIPGLPVISVQGVTANVAVRAIAGTPTIPVPPVAKWIGSVLQSGPQGSFFP